ncbi:MAG TPA: hypothetical protein VN922_24670 [Bacteroidia bacterium]|nr:hypothetical protein [Bacteroidia bacterium]
MNTDNSNMNPVDKYIIDREQFINDELSEPYINRLKAKYDNATDADKLKMLGFKSAKKPRAETKRKHEEITLHAQFCNWVRVNYPEVKFLRHEREKARSKFMGNQMKVMNTAGSMPDWESTTTTERYAGLLLEFKKPGEKWLMADNETIKAEYAFQYHCHVGLWKQRKVVYFCNDFDIAKLILKQYLEGRTMRQRVYKYPEQLAYLAEIV